MMDKDEASNIHKARDRSASAGGTACPEVDGRDSAIRVCSAWKNGFLGGSTQF
jgi:hypothetical protein